jgi:hypothetical protein
MKLHFLTHAVGNSLTDDTSSQSKILFDNSNTFQAACVGTLTSSVFLILNICKKDLLDIESQTACNCAQLNKHPNVEDWLSKSRAARSVTIEVNVNKDGTPKAFTPTAEQARVILSENKEFGSNISSTGSLESKTKTLW